MTTFEQWNYGEVQRGILPSIKKGIIGYEKAVRSLLYYTFAHHEKARLLRKNMLTKIIDFFRELSTVVVDLYHLLLLKGFGSQSPKKEASVTCWNIVKTLLVCLFDELRALRVVAGEAFNCLDIANELYLWVVFQDHRVMADFLKKNFTERPKFHPQMVMFILETMVPRVDPEGVSAACANVSALPVTVQNFMSSV